MLVTLITLMLAAADPAAPPPWPADPTRPMFITDEDWIRTPSPTQLAGARPAAATKAGTGGKVLMDCLLAYDGTLKDCRVLTETPPGLGFAAAALGLTGAFQVQPMVDGQSVTDSRLVVAVKFPPPK